MLQKLQILKKSIQNKAQDLQSSEKCLDQDVVGNAEVSVDDDASCIITHMHACQTCLHIEQACIQACVRTVGID